MTRILWDQLGERRYETGVDRGVLYLQNNGQYDEGYPWSGLTTVTESPSGAESNKQYADNIVYLNLISAEEFGGTIEAFTYPEQFEQCDGTASPVVGITIGQQGRRSFGFAYRTRVGNDVEASDFGYKLHLVYNATASPSERAYGTINDSPEALTFSWELTTIPVEVGEIDGVEYKPTAIMTIDSTKVSAANLKALEDVLYGTSGADPRLPMPAEVVSMFDGALIEVDLTTTAKQPAYNDSTFVVTLPNVTGIQWKINGQNRASGAQPALAAGATAKVTAVPTAGYKLSSASDNDWSFARP
jgi:hypothetical protein